MKIQNITQDRVLRKVSEIFDEEEKKTQKGFPTSLQCRIDVSCYVLNRTPPCYIVSDRGLAHIESNYQNKMQNSADLTSLIYEGIKVVTDSLRPHSQNNVDSPNTKGYFFNFPNIMGKIFNGLNFEPLSNGKVTLIHDGKIVEIMNNNWQNPYNLVKMTAGSYIFWPAPIKALNEGQEKTFSLELISEAPGFESVSRFFELNITSQDKYVEFFHISNAYKIPDIFLFPN